MCRTNLDVFLYWSTKHDANLIIFSMVSYFSGWDKKGLKTSDQLTTNKYETYFFGFFLFLFI
jgi:hypothetical protein